MISLDKLVTKAEGKPVDKLVTEAVGKLVTEAVGKLVTKAFAEAECEPVVKAVGRASLFASLSARIRSIRARCFSVREGSFIGSIIINNIYYHMFFGITNTYFIW
jgi:hypothetical protein